MLEQFLLKTEFSSYDDFTKNFRIKVPERFNFAYDVVDRIAAREPGRRALAWCDDKGREAEFSFGELAEQSTRAAAFFRAIGIGRGDPVMLILKHLGWEFQHSAWRVDLPSGGLRIRTEPALNEGQVVYLFSDEGVLRPRYCRVVWVPTEGSDRPCEAGLELLPPWATCGESREATQKRA